MAVAPPAPDPLRSLSLRTWLRDWMAWWQGLRKRNTHREFGRLAKVGAGTLDNAIQGRRVPTATTLAAFNRVFELDAARLGWLCLLAELDAAVSVDARLEVLRRMWAHPSAAAARACEGEDVRYLSRWLHVAIRELAVIGPLPRDPVQLRERMRFEVSAEEVESSLQVLLELRYLVPRGDTLVAPEQAVETSPTAIGVEAYHRDFLALAARALDTLPGTERFCGALTIALPASRIPEVHELVWRALGEVRDLGDAAGVPDEVVQVQFQVFPVTRPASGS